MEVQTRHTPAFGVARVVLAAGEAVQADAEAKVASSFGMGESRQARGARGRGPTIFTAPGDGGWVDLAPRHPGDVYALGFDGRTGWSIARNVVLARPPTIRPDESWPPLQSLFGSDSGFLEHYSGHGQLVLAAAGPVDALTLDRGEVITVTPGFLLAYPDSLQCRLRAVDPAGPQSVRTGEGLELDFAGPGTVLLQARRHS
ncbi:AIM24 family protein [Amycolatopsis palatopharyngis]|uniref:AIM24 family protein n=1 Tax=Amycolatopsis palatopharyngis TaxID=187982 RepID=UPI000E23F13C|nr:AIM24 family protein [Amycolatopsis palatopharyngis]